MNGLAKLGIAVAAVVAIGLAAALISGNTEGGKKYRVPSGSMEPSFEIGKIIRVDQGAYDDADPEVGDVVVLHPPAAAENGVNECGTPKPRSAACAQAGPQKSELEFIKRVVAGPGDTLAIEDGHPVVNGTRATEDFIRPCRGGSACNLPTPITIPPGTYFMLGDNRGESDDSRFWGPVPKDWIVGRVKED